MISSLPWFYIYTADEELQYTETKKKKKKGLEKTTAQFLLFHTNQYSNTTSYHIQAIRGHFACTLYKIYFKRIGKVNWIDF